MANKTTKKSKKKTARKTAGKKKPAKKKVTKKQAGKKKTAKKKAAKKKTTKKKAAKRTPARKKASKKKAGARKPAARKKTAKKKTAGKGAAKKKPAAKKQATRKRTTGKEVARRKSGKAPGPSHPSPPTGLAEPVISTARNESKRPRFAEPVLTPPPPETTAGAAAPVSPEVRDEPRVAGIGEEAVLSATGKGWNQWFEILEGAGAPEIGHREMARHLAETHGLTGWWSQMVTVGYEQARGLRKKHETAEGFSISRSLTLDVPVERLFAAWNDASVRDRWLGEPGITLTTVTEPKSMRILWKDGLTRLSVDFYPKGHRKSQVTVQHMKLADEAEAERMKEYWGRAMESLREALTAGAE